MSKVDKLFSNIGKYTGKRIQISFKGVGGRFKVLGVIRGVKDGKLLLSVTHLAAEGEEIIFKKSVNMEIPKEDILHFLFVNE